MSKTITIAGRKIGQGEPAFIVTEVSANHEQKLENAIAIIKAAKKAGVDAIKLQTYTPDTITIDSRKKWFFVGGEQNKDNPEIWHGKTFHDLYKDAYTPWEWHKELQRITHELGMIFFATPFDTTAVDFLETLHVPCYKVAAYECTDITLLRRIAKTGKPVIMSVGFATLPEIELSVKTLRDGGTKEIALLHCLTSYTKTHIASATNLRTILDLRDRFDVAAGLSENMGGIETPVLAAAMGASIIEKHMVVKHNPKILDDQFSLDAKEFKTMVARIRAQEQLMGVVKYGPQTKQEEDNRRYRRSLFAVENIKKGERLSPKNVRSIRPADGLETKHYDEVIGKIATTDIERGTPLSWELIA